MPFWTELVALISAQRGWPVVSPTMMPRGTKQHARINAHGKHEIICFVCVCITTTTTGVARVAGGMRDTERDLVVCILNLELYQGQVLEGVERADERGIAIAADVSFVVQKRVREAAPVADGKHVLTGDTG